MTTKTSDTPTAVYGHGPEGLFSYPGMSGRREVTKPGGKSPGRSIKNPRVYEALKKRGYSKAQAAAISNSMVKKEAKMSDHVTEILIEKGYTEEEIVKAKGGIGQWIRDKIGRFASKPGGGGGGSSSSGAAGAGKGRSGGAGGDGAKKGPTPKGIASTMDRMGKMYRARVDTVERRDGLKTIITARTHDVASRMVGEAFGKMGFTNPTGKTRKTESGGVSREYRHVNGKRSAWYDDPETDSFGESYSTVHWG